MKRDKIDVRDARKEFLSGIGVPIPKPFKPDDFQLRAIEALSQGHDTLVIAPTGTGKTYIAIEAIRNALTKKQRAIYTAPLKALSNTKYAEFKNLFEPTYSVGLLTGDRKIETNADVVVATTEIYRNDLYSYGESYALVILDELHYLADPQRGPVWEESIILSPRSSTLLMLSASISNAKELAAWIEDVRGRPVTIIIETERLVELRLGFLHPEMGVMPLEDKDKEVFHEVTTFYEGGRESFSRRRQSGHRQGKSFPRSRSRGRKKS